MIVIKFQRAAAVILSALAACAAAASPLLPDEKVREAFGGVEGVFVVIDCDRGEVFSSDPALAKEPFGPCSTFKIWNTLIGLEEGILNEPDDPFWKWDGVERELSGWNRDLTLREAFKASCVPAYQGLARKIGPEKMQLWLDKLGYGNRDQCGRPDAFWLPRAGRKTILVSPLEQAQMICKLLGGKLPVKASSVAVLQEIMRSETGKRGTLYGKTGSGLRGAAKDVDFDMGWWVGFLDRSGKRYAYACLVLGPGLSGKDARRITEDVFRGSGML